MPLNRDMDIQQYVQNREQAGRSSAALPEKRSITPQPNLNRDRTQQLQGDVRLQPRTNSRDRHSHDRPGRDTEMLKLPVPNTIGKPKSNLLSTATGSNKVPDLSEPAPPAAQNTFSRLNPLPKSHREMAVSAFDDTQSLHLDDSTSMAGDQDVHQEPHFAHDGRGHESPHIWINHSDPQLPEFGRVTKDPSSDDRSALVGFGYNWQAEADAERLRQGRNPIHDTGLSHGSVYTEEYDDGYEQDGEDGEEEADAWAHTPSRTRLTSEGKVISRSNEESTRNEDRRIVLERPANPSLLKHEKSLSDAAPLAIQQLPVNQPVDRFKVPSKFNKPNDAEPHKTTHLTIQPPRPDVANIQPPPFSSKVSSYHESSSEEDQPARHHNTSNSETPSSKRPRPSQDLDFDPDTLKTKTMTELDAISFTTDPSQPPAQPALDANGTPMTLSAKLTNLTKMQPDAQRQLFQSLNDAEREQTATWFLEKFKTDMQRLMDVRLARRKGALKFELEVKKREREVEVKRGDVERELAELKKGGGELISGRAAAGK